MNVSSSTTSKWLQGASIQLRNAGIATARLDSLILLEDATGKDRSYLLAHGDEELDEKVVQKLNQQITRRTNHEPLAYIRGKSEFYGREFTVTPHTLEPRPETETMIDLLKMTLSQKITDQRVRPLGMVDVGTGSGCIAITAKLEIPELEVIATDISKECLEVTQKNAENLGADIKLSQGNLLEAVQTLDSDLWALVCNLPYVPDTHTINEAAMHEPRLAIFGGADGLDLYRELFKQIDEFNLKPTYIMTESLPFQHHSLATIARHYGYVLEKTDDFIQFFVS